MTRAKGQLRLLTGLHLEAKEFGAVSDSVKTLSGYPDELKIGYIRSAP